MKPLNLTHYARCINCAIEIQELTAHDIFFTSDKVEEARDVFAYEFEKLDGEQRTSVNIVIGHLRSMGEYHQYKERKK